MLIMALTNRSLQVYVKNLRFLTEIPMLLIQKVLSEQGVPTFQRISAKPALLSLSMPQWLITPS